MVKKMFNEIRLCNPMTYVFKGHVKIVKIYMGKFNTSILNRLTIMFFFVNSKCMRKPDVIFNKTVTKLVTILTKCFFPYLNPTSYLKRRPNIKIPFVINTSAENSNYDFSLFFPVITGTLCC